MRHPDPEMRTDQIAVVKIAHVQNGSCRGFGQNFARRCASTRGKAFSADRAGSNLNGDSRAPVTLTYLKRSLEKFALAGSIFILVTSHAHADANVRSNIPIRDIVGVILTLALSLVISMLAYAGFIMKPPNKRATEYLPHVVAIVLSLLGAILGVSLK